MPPARGHSLRPISPSIPASSLLPSAVTKANEAVPALLCLRFGMKLHKAPFSRSLLEAPVPGYLPKATLPRSPGYVVP